MLKTLLISFSQAPNSMNYRGLILCNQILNADLYDFAGARIPLCNVNNTVDSLPVCVKRIVCHMRQYDQFVFAIPEYTGHYSAAFKNLMDWLVVSEMFNSTHGASYPFSGKPVHVVTFTPTVKNSGSRHFGMTRHLLQDKMGADIKSMTVYNDCWRNLLPNRLDFVEDLCDLIKQCTLNSPNLNQESKHDIERWNKLYKVWEERWTNYKI